MCEDGRASGAILKPTKAAGLAINVKTTCIFRHVGIDVSHCFMPMTGGPYMSSVGSVMRTVSGNAESPPKSEGPLGGARQNLSRTRALELSVWLFFPSGITWEV